MTSSNIRGELMSFRVAGSDGWGFGTLRRLHDGGDLAIVGKLIGAHAGDTIELDGDLVTHAKYGKQLKIKSCRVVLPQDQTGVVGWLASKLPQISKRRAEQLVEKFGVQGLWDLLDNDQASQLCIVDGITLPRAEEIVAAYKLHKKDRERHIVFKQWGMTDGQIARVVELWKDKAVDRISENPYRLMEHVRGFGWQRSDDVAMRMGVRRDDPARLCAGLMHAMDTATQSGHCFVATGKLVGIAATKILQVSDEKAVRSALDLLVRSGKLERLEQNIYLPTINDAEGALALAFARRARQAQQQGAA
jgi:exodeoxyribonuclease V alpha subunit